MRKAQLGAALAGLAGMVGTLLTPVAAHADDDPTPGRGEELYLVTLRGAGTSGYVGPLPRAVYADVLVRTQDAALTRVGAEQPVYRWTTALNGVAVVLDDTQVDTLRTDPTVVAVEANEVRPLAGSPGPVQNLPDGSTTRGGAGTVVGLVDSGIWPDSSLFATVPGLGRRPAGFTGECEVGEGFGPADCNDKLVGARWFVEGFGRDRLRTTSSLSPRDDSGHGTQMASIAAGNAGVDVQAPGLRRQRYGGVAPQARISVYKACWTAPDPDDDGCATADLVTAIDRATADGVDVLNLSVGGPAEIDTVERALLGAAEAGTVVVAAAGNTGQASYAAHASPWVTSVGGVSGEQRRGTVDLPGLAPLAGAMASSRAAGPARLVLGAQAAAGSASPTDAALCLPGTLDASLVAGTIVVCERGGIGRVEKSEAVARADGVGMVLVNTTSSDDDVAADLHRVPTVHLDRASGAELRAWRATRPRSRVTLSPAGVSTPAPRVTTWSATGDPTGPVIKPDLVGPAAGVLGAVPPGVRQTRWDFVTGTSAAAAWTSGLALRMVARHDWSADRVRSALVTGASGVAGDPSVLREGAGRPSTDAARPALAYLTQPGAYRAWLDGVTGIEAVNPTSVLLSRGASRAERTITNVSGRTLTFTARTAGFTDHRVTVSPATVTLRPGRSATFRVRATGTPSGAVDDGWLTWESAAGTHGRIPVAVTR